MPVLEDTCGGNNLEIKDKDIVSDAAICDLYQRWMVFYKVDRDEDERVERFPIFKERVTSIHRFNHEKHLWTKGLNEWSDSHRDEIERILFCKIESSSSDDE